MYAQEEEIMRKLILPIILSALLLATIFRIIQVARGQDVARPDGMQVLRSESQDDSLREIYAPPGVDASQAPDIGFIDSPTVTCYQPDPSQDACYINWYYMSVDASPNYMIAMTVTLNTIGIVGRIGGFFQTSMYVPYNMYDRGFKVACGSLGAGGNPYLGNAYSWTINARDSSNLKSANYGTAYCPAYAP
jgi:hypothetical protein